MMPARKDEAALLIRLRAEACDCCGCCVGVCPEDAIVLTERALAIIAGRCTGCSACVWVCPFEALVVHPPVHTTPGDHAPAV